MRVPSDEAVIECVTVATQAPGNQHELWMVVVARRRRVYELIAPLRAAGVVIEAADIAELAQRNLAMQYTPAGRTVAMLTLDSQRGMLTISRDDGMYATRQLDPIAVALASEDEDRRESLIERLALELQRTSRRRRAPVRRRTDRPGHRAMRPVHRGGAGWPGPRPARAGPGAAGWRIPGQREALRPCSKWPRTAPWRRWRSGPRCASTPNPSPATR